MQLSANTQVKTIEGHYTGHFKAVVTKPQSTPERIEPPNPPPRAPLDPTRSPAPVCVADVLVMRDVACAGYVAGGNTRWFAKGEDDSYSAGNAQDFPGGNEMYNVYNAELQLGQVHYGEDMKAAGLRRRLKPYAFATPADRPPACVPSQRTRTSSRRAPPTTPRASSAPAAATIRSLAASCPSSRARATLAPTRFPEMRAGVGASRSRSRRLGMRWCRSSWPSTPRWPTRPVKRATRVPLSPLPPNQCNTKHCHHILHLHLTWNQRRRQ